MRTQAKRIFKQDIQKEERDRSQKNKIFRFLKKGKNEKGEITDFQEMAHSFIKFYRGKVPKEWFFELEI